MELSSYLHIYCADPETHGFGIDYTRQREPTKQPEAVHRLVRTNCAKVQETYWHTNNHVVVDKKLLFADPLKSRISTTSYQNTHIQTGQLDTPKKRHAMPQKLCKGIQLFLHSIERNLRRGLHALGILVESAVGLVALFLNSGTVLHEFLRNGLASGLEHVDKSAGEVLLGFAEEGDGEAVLAGTAGTGEIC